MACGERIGIDWEAQVSLLCLMLLSVEISSLKQKI